MKSTMEIFLYEKLPHDRIAAGCTDKEEKPLNDVEELIQLYENKYGQMADITYHILREDDATGFIDALNQVFERNALNVRVNPALVYLMADQYIPMLVVEGEIISRGVYPDLTSLRGGSKSVSRGYEGEHHCH